MYIGELTLSILTDLFIQTANYLPNLLSGLVILLIGLLIARVLQRVTISLFNIDGVKKMLTKARLSSKDDSMTWSILISQIVRWTVVLLFLIPAAEIWGIPRVTEVFTQLLLFIPNVFVAVFVGLVGLTLANIVSELVKKAVTRLGGRSRGLIVTLARYSIIFFTVLVVLSQLGIAADLIRILFSGVVMMLALAGGLAFGLGGKSSAEEILRDLKARIRK